MTMPSPLCHLALRCLCSFIGSVLLSWGHSNKEPYTPHCLEAKVPNQRWQGHTL